MQKDDILAAFEDLKPHLNIEWSLKDEQLQVITNLLNGKNTLTVLPTGYGKSMTFILPPLIANKVRMLSDIYIENTYFLNTYHPSPLIIL